MVRGILTVLVLLVVGAVAALYIIGSGWLGEHWGGGVITEVARPEAVTAQRSLDQAATASAAGVADAKQILFGDLHVHTTYSLDAFAIAMPAAQGQGAHPPADACDFARFCAALDFWSINDHAAANTPEHWRETIDSIRQCNAVTDPANPDLVSYLGWEWTQVGATAKDHWGHKNVILQYTDDANIPARPIGATIANATGSDGGVGFNPFVVGLLPFAMRDPAYLDMVTYLNEVAGVPTCPRGVPVRELPTDCREQAPTPQELFAKLDEWGFPSLVIPHGTTWGYYTPLGSSWDKQLNTRQHDPGRQRLVEVFSGHGNSEEYRPWREIIFEADGSRICPSPLLGYVPSCWRAGEIIRERCEHAGEDDSECDRRAVEARAHYLDGDISGWLTVPGSTIDEWLDAGQCSDCYLPAFNYRPRNSVQYMMSLSDFEGSDPLRFRFGFMASSDNHSARPGTGYKEYDRVEMTEARFETLAKGVLPQRGPGPEPVAYSVPYESPAGFSFFRVRETERGASFFVTGGLIATHANGRDRDAIWDAMQRREVYGTSGPRILLWFDLLTGDPGSRVPMGGEVELSETPVFEVRAVGSFEQKPGCPDYATNALSPERLEYMCRGECYHPSDARRRIDRIEVVRIRPQATPDESVDGLIEDPWRTLQCPPDPAGCTVQFEDPDFAVGGRDALYYVRAVEEPTPHVNAGNLRCLRDDDGGCMETNPCVNVPYEEDCLEPSRARAWSSPIFVDHGGLVPAAEDERVGGEEEI